MIGGILRTLVVFALTLAACYIAVAFFKADFDLTHWTDDLRYRTLILPVVVAVLYFFNYEQ